MSSESRATWARWLASGLIVAGVHGGAAVAMLHWDPPSEPDAPAEPLFEAEVPPILLPLVDEEFGLELLMPEDEELGLALLMLDEEELGLEFERLVEEDGE